MDGSWGDAATWDTAYRAFHEAGHAVIALAFGLPIDHATVEPTDDYEGRVQLHAPFDDDTDDKDIEDIIHWAFSDDDQKRAWRVAYYRGHLLSTVGGVAASRLRWGAADPDEDEGDRERFYDLFDHIDPDVVAALGYGVPEWTRDRVEIAGREFDCTIQDSSRPYSAAIAEAARLLTEHWPAVGAVAQALIRHGRLTGDELVAIADGADPTLHAADRRADYQATLACAAQTEHAWRSRLGITRLGIT